MGYQWNDKVFQSEPKVWVIIIRTIKKTARLWPAAVCEPLAGFLSTRYQWIEEIPLFHSIAISSYRDQYYGHSDLAKVENLRLIQIIITQTLSEQGILEWL